jgi:hypothetical protein
MQRRDRGKEVEEEKDEDEGGVTRATLFCVHVHLR